jgi:N-acyl-D-amino-acid deacylase
VIKGGKVVDGTGAPWYFADIAIADGKIARIGRVPQGLGVTCIDAEGLIVAPGFVDMMGQTATPMLEDSSAALNLLTQGITTINAGEGGSAAPLNADEGRQQGWTTLREYFALLESKGLPINVAQTVGHTQVRRIVLGDVDRRPSEDEMLRMKQLVREAMQDGAIGLSTALIYPPAVFAPTREIAELAAVAGEFGGSYYTHMRNEGDQLLEAIDEAIEIGAWGHTPVHIFHLKAAGKRNWGKMPLAIARIQSARASGQPITADIYPYINNGLGISALIHPRHSAAGHASLIKLLDDAAKRLEIQREMESTEGWENWFRHAGGSWDRVIIGRSNLDRYRALDGQSVAAMAKSLDEDPWTTFFALVRSNAFALPETMSDANKILAMRQEFVSFCTDVGPASANRSASHPRASGAFPRLLSRYVRDLGAMSLERAIAQASAVAANDIHAYDRGRIAVGLAADVIVFDYDKLVDRADFANPHALSEGMSHVIVNGRLVLTNGKYTGSRPGVVLRGPGYDDATASHNLASAQSDPKFASFDRLVSDFIQRHRVPGVSVAVGRHGKVVFARGYGYADLATKEVVQTDSLFRIASLSKPITAVAILQLVEQGKLQLDHRIFDLLQLDSPELSELNSFDKRWRDITIRHLLEHRGGWDRDASFDAMFQSVRFAEQMNSTPPANTSEIIRAMLSQPLDFPPGERYAYSNFGYCLLGRAIEKLTNKKYHEYIRESLLAPLDITSMRIGGTRLEQRAEREVRYYHPGSGRSVFSQDLNERVPWPYGAWYLEAMDSHGGWLATASDLAKFASSFDDDASCPILGPHMIASMFGRPPGEAGFEKDGSKKPVYYSLGWKCRLLDDEDGKFNAWHTGSLPGTATIMIRRHDGTALVGLLNARVSPTSDHLGLAINQVLDAAADQIEWEK